MLKFKDTISFERCASGTLIVLFLFIMMGCLYGCGKSTVKKEKIILNLIPDSRLNDERPVYIMIRKVNSRIEFLVDNYDFISDMVYANPPNENFLALHMLMPGQKEQIQVVKPDRSDIGLYVLFTNPGENWKLLLEDPLKPEYKIIIKNNELEENTKGFFW
jgi:hypothetical protein